MSYSPQDLYKKILGRKGERLVVAYLKKQGCTILKRNFVTPFGEADIIAQDGDEVAFVEVKTRMGIGYGTPREAVGKAKQARYQQIAKFYWKCEREEPNARFDVAEVGINGEITYYKNAF